MSVPSGASDPGEIKNLELIIDLWFSRCDKFICGHYNDNLGYNYNLRVVQENKTKQ